MSRYGSAAAVSSIAHSPCPAGYHSLCALSGFGSYWVLKINRVPTLAQDAEKMVDFANSESLSKRTRKICYYSSFVPFFVSLDPPNRDYFLAHIAIFLWIPATVSP